MSKAAVSKPTALSCWMASYCKARQCSSTCSSTFSLFIHVINCKILHFSSTLALANDAKCLTPREEEGSILVQTVECMALQGLGYSLEHYRTDHPEGLFVLLGASPKWHFFLFSLIHYWGAERNMKRRREKKRALDIYGRISLLCFIRDDFYFILTKISAKMWICL